MRGTRHTLQGKVVKTGMQKTVTVLIERLVQHPKYKKYIKKRKKVKARDEKSETGVGDIVQIMQTRALSKTVHWRVVKILRKKET